jgi:hypothetical protein
MQTQGEAEAPLACRYHEMRAAVSFCAGCGVLICESCHQADARGLARCPVCRQRAEREAQGAAHAALLEVSGRGERDEEGLAAAAREAMVELPPVPLEDPSSGGLVRRTLETIKLALLAPPLFYPRVKRSRAWLTPGVFGYMALTVGGEASLAWSLLLGNNKALEGPQFDELAAQGIPLVAVKVMLFLLVPFAMLLQMAFGAALLHLAAKAVGGRGSVQKSFQLYCWSAAAQLLGLIPFLGAFLMPVAMVFSQLEGVRVLHELSAGRALLAVVIPLAVNVLFAVGFM